MPNNINADPQRLLSDGNLLQASIADFQADIVAGQAPTIVLLAGAVVDEAGNSATNRSVIITSSATAPTISACFQVDRNVNGRIDGLIVETSKTIIDSSASVARFTVSGGLTGSSYSIRSISSAVSGSSPRFLISFSEGSVGLGTGATSPISLAVRI